MKLLSVIALTCLVYQSPSASTWLDSPRGWKGLVPLQSTRSDVSHTLGTPDRLGNTYDSDDATISFFYSFGQCELGEDSQRWDVPLDVVVAIRIWPKESPVVTSRELREHGFEKLNVELLPGMAQYQNGSSGVMITCMDGRLSNLTIGPTSSELHHRCSRSPGPPVSYPRGEPYCAGIEAEADVVRSGGQVRLTALCTEPNPDALTFRWLIPGGRLIGDGSTVVWDTTGLTPGTYTVVLKVPVNSEVDITRTRQISIESSTVRITATPPN